MTTFQREGYGPNEHDDPVDARPTVAGPFGALCDKITIGFDPDLGAHIRRKAVADGQDCTEYLRDVVYKHETGKTYTEWHVEAMKSRREAARREAAEREQNGTVFVPSMRFFGGRR